MSSYFHPSGAGDSWGRVGRVEITSTVAVVALGALGILAAVVWPPLPQALAYAPDTLLRGQAWRVVTWPLADSISLWSVLNLVLLWYFGRYLENDIGRNAMAWLYVGIWGSLTLTTSVVRVFGPTAIAGMQLVEFAVLLLWIAQYPTMRFLFNIPAWAFGAFILGLNVLSLLAARAMTSLLVMLLSLALVAVFARSRGLLSQYAWIPGARRSSSPKPRQSKSAQRQQQRQRSAAERIDELLDKINAEGIHSLTKKERAELDKLRQQRRG